MKRTFIFFPVFIFCFIPAYSQVPPTINWFPLEVGNKFQYFGKYNEYWNNNYGDYFIKLFQVTDSVWNNNIKYYLVDGFYFFDGGTKIRYDEGTERILVLSQNQEHLFMDFTKSVADTFMQIQNDYTFRNTIIIDTTIVILGDTIEAKGFYNIYRHYGGITYSDIATWCYFAPEIGWVFQHQESYISPFPKIDLFLIEHLIFNEGYSFHKKHYETATINFLPVTFIPDGDSLYQNLIVLHPFSKQNIPASHGYFSYINAYLQSFYFNGTDTIWNAEFIIPQTTEKDFLLNYQLDTLKYAQGYQLYYRISAVDKGIVSDTFYTPQTGYYRLFWKDSTAALINTEWQSLSYSLAQNYPNPFNPTTKIGYRLKESGYVKLMVYDIKGELIEVMVNKEQDAGYYDVQFTGKNLTSGIYLYRIEIIGEGNIPRFSDMKKMILVK